MGSNENSQPENNQEINQKSEEEAKELTPEEKITELEDKVARTFAEMENQRRRFEKEKLDAFEYGGYSFAKEALNLIDNLDRSKNVLENDDKLKNTEALKKTLEHLDIIKKDLISIFEKNNIKPIDCLNQKLDPNFHQAIMEKEENQNNADINQNQKLEEENTKPEENLNNENKHEIERELNNEIKESTPEEKIAELEDKVARTSAEMQ